MFGDGKIRLAEQQKRTRALQLELLLLIDEEKMSTGEAARALKIAPQRAGSLYCMAKLKASNE